MVLLMCSASNLDQKKDRILLWAEENDQLDSLLDVLREFTGIDTDARPT